MGLKTLLFLHPYSRIFQELFNKLDTIVSFVFCCYIFFRLGHKMTWHKKTTKKKFAAWEGEAFSRNTKLFWTIILRSLRISLVFTLGKKSPLKRFFFQFKELTVMKWNWTKDLQDFIGRYKKKQWKMWPFKLFCYVFSLSLCVIAPNPSYWRNWWW